MITLKVKRNKQGQIVLADKNPRGVRLKFPVVHPISDTDKQLRAMWRDMDRKSDDYEKSDVDYPWQQRLIRRLAKKHFGVDLKWKSVTVDKRDDSYGWPTTGYWETNKTWFNKEIKRLLGEKR